MSRLGTTFACLLGLIGLIVIGAPAAAATHPQALLGPIAGAVTATSAHIWVRTDDPASVQIEYSRSPDLQNALTTPPVQTGAETDNIAVLPLGNLAPASTYYYRVDVNGLAVEDSNYPHLTTFLPCGASASFSFGVLTDFGSYDAAPPEAPIQTNTFNRLAGEDPPLNFVVIGGDFWHNGVDENSLLSNADYVSAEQSRYRAMYSLDSSQGPYDDFVNRVLSNFALAHFWDDHDIGTDNATKTYPHKGLALQVLKQYFPVYTTGPFGDWQRFCYGNTDVFLLDARSQRDPQHLRDNAGKSLLDGDNLGATGQWSWLTKGLETSNARWKVILTPVTFNPTVIKWDDWSAYQYEHDRLVDFIRDHKIRGVVMISGDTHGGGLDNGKHAGLPEMLVPGPNMKSSCFTSRNVGKWTNGAYGTTANRACPGYGIVHILTNPDRMQFAVKDDNGAVMLKMEVP